MATSSAYVLSFQCQAAKPGRTIRARLESADLDPDLHPGRALLVILKNVRSSGSGDSEFAMDSFMLDSLKAYVENQKRIRKLLADQLGKDRQRSLGGRKAENTVKDVWRHAKLKYLYLSARDVPDIGLLQRSGWPAEEIEQLARRSDTPDTCWSLMLGIEVDWDEEHSVHTARLRDGECVEMSIEGAG